MIDKYFGPRQKKILKFLLNKSDWVKGAEIALEFGITDRTVRSEIAYINASFKEDGPIVTSFNRKGYYITNKERTMEILESNLNGFPIYPEERVNFIIKTLLFEKYEIDIYELAEKILVSESTIENDLKKVKDIIGENNRKVTLIKRGMNISLLGSEKYKRALLSDLLFKETHGNFLNLSRYKKYFGDYNLDKIKMMLIAIIKKYNFLINEMSIINLIIHIAITLDRIKNKNILDFSEDIEDTTYSLEYEIAKEFCNQLKDIFNIDFPKQEVSYISYLFLGKKIIKNVYEKRDEINDVIEAYYIDLTESLLKSIYNEFGIDFTQDDSLFIGLALHIKNMHERLKNNANLRNLILEDLKRKYPLIFEIGIFTCNEFYKITNIKVNEHEISFIALHLGAAYERFRKNVNSLFRVALVCPTGYTTSNLLLSKINNLYADKIDVIGVFSFLEVHSLAYIKPDFIFTTVEFEHNLGISTIVISPFLNEQDIKIINKNLNLLENRNRMKRLQVNIEKYFTNKLFYTNKCFNNEFDIINFMTQDLYEKGFVPKEYNQFVMEREKISATSFGNLVAIPHAIVMNAYATAVSVAILDKPILWGEHKVQLVLMFAIKSGERKKMNELYNHIIEVIDTQEGVNYLIKANEFNDFINRILSYQIVDLNYS